MEHITDIIDIQLEAYNRHDIEALLKTYTTDVIFIDMKSGEKLFSGKEQVRRNHTETLFNRENLKAVVVNRIVMGNMVVDHEHVFGLDSRGYIEAITMYNVVHGKISRIWCMK